MSNQIEIEGKKYTEREITSLNIEGKASTNNTFTIDESMRGKIVKANIGVIVNLGEESISFSEEAKVSSLNNSENYDFNIQEEQNTRNEKSIIKTIIEKISNIIKMIVKK